MPAIVFLHLFFGSYWTRSITCYHSVNTTCTVGFDDNPEACPEPYEEDLSPHFGPYEEDPYSPFWCDFMGFGQRRKCDTSWECVKADCFPDELNFLGGCDYWYSCSVGEGSSCETCRDPWDSDTDNHCETCNQGYILQGTSCVFPPTTSPSHCPSKQPSPNPTASSPSLLPSTKPSVQPSVTPSKNPSRIPTPSFPSSTPSSSQPSQVPTLGPSPATPSTHPSAAPSNYPTMSPSFTPPSYLPSPVFPTVLPSALPTFSPSSEAPSLHPSAAPSNFPTASPSFTLPSYFPTSMLPSLFPSSRPSLCPTTGSPSSSPSRLPSMLPSSKPSSARPSIPPSADPSNNPSSLPSFTLPSYLPSHAFPTVLPSSSPSLNPHSTAPSSSPSKAPTLFPSSTSPSISPTTLPPTFHPTRVPTTEPTSEPTTHPSFIPTLVPTRQPSLYPTLAPSHFPSMNPSTHPNIFPTIDPTCIPTSVPSCPSLLPTSVPTCHPSKHPTSVPSHSPSVAPSSHPSMRPSLIPTSTPSAQPSTHPTSGPSYFPSTITPSFPPEVTISWALTFSDLDRDKFEEIEHLLIKVIAFKAGVDKSAVTLDYSTGSNRRRLQFSVVEAEIGASNVASGDLVVAALAAETAESISAELTQSYNEENIIDTPTLVNVGTPTATVLENESMREVDTSQLSTESNSSGGVPIAAIVVICIPLLFILGGAVWWYHNKRKVQDDPYALRINELITWEDSSEPEQTTKDGHFGGSVGGAEDISSAGGVENFSSDTSIDTKYIKRMPSTSKEAGGGPFPNDLQYDNATTITVLPPVEAPPEVEMSRMVQAPKPVTTAGDSGCITDVNRDAMPQMFSTRSARERESAAKENQAAFKQICAELIHKLETLWELDFQQHGEAYTAFQSMKKSNPHCVYWLELFLFMDILTVETVMDYFTLPHHDTRDISKVEELIMSIQLTQDEFFSPTAADKVISEVWGDSTYDVHADALDKAPLTDLVTTSSDADTSMQPVGSSANDEEFRQICTQLVCKMGVLWELDFQRHGKAYTAFQSMKKSNPHCVYWLELFLVMDNLNVETVMDFFTLPHHNFKDIKKVEELLMSIEFTKEEFFATPVADQVASKTAAPKSTSCETSTDVLFETPNQDLSNLETTVSESDMSSDIDTYLGDTSSKSGISQPYDHEFGQICSELVQKLELLWELDFQKHGEDYTAFQSMKKSNPHCVYWLQLFLVMDTLTVETVMDYFTLPHHNICDHKKVEEMIMSVQFTQEEFFSSKAVRKVTLQEPEWGGASFDSYINRDAAFQEICTQLVIELELLWELDFQLHGEEYSAFKAMKATKPHCIYWLELFLAMDTLNVDTVMDFFTLPHHNVKDIEKVEELMSTIQSTKEQFFSMHMTHGEWDEVHESPAKNSSPSFVDTMFEMPKETDEFENLVELYKEEVRKSYLERQGALLDENLWKRNQHKAEAYAKRQSQTAEVQDELRKFMHERANFSDNEAKALCRKLSQSIQERKLTGVERTTETDAHAATSAQIDRADVDSSEEAGNSSFTEDFFLQ